MQQAPLLNNSKPFLKWSNPAEDTEFKFIIYLFNVTNPDGIENGEKPVLEEAGPYVFLQKKIFNIYDWNNDRTLLNFKMKRVFYPDEASKEKLNDQITTLNVPLIVSVFEKSY
jgi:hypothetical protein